MLQNETGKSIFVGVGLSKWDDPSGAAWSGPGTSSFTYSPLRLIGMFHLHQNLAYYLYPNPVDMRKSFYTLSGIVNSEMDRDVRSGEVYIFINRKQTIMKILHMEYAGMVIYHKKLDSGR